MAGGSTMAIVPVAQRMTAEEFVALEPPQRAERWELVDGEVVVHQLAALHGEMNGNALFALATWTRAGPSRGHAIVPIDVKLDEHNVFAPDVLWYADGRAPDPHSEPPYALPDIAVEVRAPSTWRYDVGAKKAAYEREGLPELWLVDNPAHTVLVFRRSGADVPAFDVAAELEEGDELTSPLLPGFALPIAEVFRLP